MAGLPQLLIPEQEPVNVSLVFLMHMAEVVLALKLENVNFHFWERNLSTSRRDVAGWHYRLLCDPEWNVSVAETPERYRTNDIFTARTESK